MTSTCALTKTKTNQHWDPKSNYITTIMGNSIWVYTAIKYQNSTIQIPITSDADERVQDMHEKLPFP